MDKNEDYLVGYRLFSPYRELLLKRAKAARMKPTALARLAVMDFLDSEKLAISERLARIEEELTALHRDFNEATRDDDDLPEAA